MTRHRARLGLGGWLAIATCGGPPPQGPFVAAPPAPPEAIDVTLFLIGDAGAPAAPPDSEPVLVALRAEAAAVPNPVIVFLGDNVYPDGMPDSADAGRPDAERRLGAQVDVLPDSARGIFVPGNHDWAGNAADGWERVRRQGRYLAGRRDAVVALVPADGCPGPVAVDLGATLRLVVLDTQWWLRDGPRPLDPTSSCGADSEAEVVDSLRTLLRGAGTRRRVVIGHHPLESGGPHGGHFNFQDHVFPLTAWKGWLWIPLPIIGSAYPFARGSGVSDQDVSGPSYRRLRATLDSVFRDVPPLVYAGGHDHAQQVIGGTSAGYLLVTGGGYYGHTSPVAWRNGTRFAASKSGYMRLDVQRDGRVRLGVRAVDRAAVGREVFSLWLN